MFSLSFTIIAVASFGMPAIKKICLVKIKIKNYG